MGFDTLLGGEVRASSFSRCLSWAAGAQWQAPWTSERTAYLGTALQTMLRGYTEAAVGFTTALVKFISRFAVQARRACGCGRCALFAARQCIKCMRSHCASFVAAALQSSRCGGYASRASAAGARMHQAAGHVHSVC